MVENNPFNFDNDKHEEEEAAAYPIPIPEIKLNVHTLLNRVLDTKDSTKVGFLSEPELGVPRYPVRALKDMALVSKMICDNPFMAKYFSLEGEDVLATSLSRKGKFINIAVTQKRTIADETKQMSGQKSSWFSKKENEREDE